MREKVVYFWLGLAVLFPLNALAGHPDLGDMARVKDLAHEVHQSARHVHRQAEAVADPHNGWHQTALTDLHDLEEAAKHFHHQVETYFQSPQHTESDFRNLERALRKSQNSFSAVGHHWHHLEHDFQQLSNTFGLLRAYYSNNRRGRYPTVGDMPRVRALAHDLHEKAAHVHRLAEAAVNPGNHAHRQALSDLHELEEAAEHFHGQVERYFQNPRHTAEDFRELAAMVRRSQNSFGAVAHHWHHLEHDFQETVAVYHALNAYYTSDHHGPSPILVTRVRVGGSWRHQTVKVYGEITGHGVHHAGVYVDGILHQQISTQGSFYVRVSLRRGVHSTIEVRATDYSGRVYRHRINY